eukprot:993738-Amphidinium_carterae.1
MPGGQRLRSVPHVTRLEHSLALWQRLFMQVATPLWRDAKSATSPGVDHAHRDALRNVLRLKPTKQ